MKKVFLLFILTLVAGTSFAVTTPDEVMFVSGNVSDKQSHETLAGVEVVVKGMNVKTYTDFDGNFFLPALPRGSYELEFHYITYSASQVVTDNCTHCSTVTVELTQE